MKIVIVGIGKVGYSLAEQLSKEDHDIVVIDRDLTVLEDAQENFDVIAVAGNGACLDIQRAAGVENSDLLIATTPTDELNMLCCLLARKLGCPRAISRIRNPEYSAQVGFLADDLGLSMAINPEQAAAREIYRTLQFPSFLKRDSFARGKVELLELKLSADNILVGHRLDELFSLLNFKILVCAVEHDYTVTIPNGSYVFRVGDKITITAPRSNIGKLIRRLDIAAQKIRSVMIIGGSRISIYLADELLRAGVHVKIIDLDRDVCLALAERLPEASVVQGDGSLSELLDEEGIRQTDAVVTLTNLDEENLIISLYAEHIGVPKTVTKINRPEYSSLFADKGLGSTVCPKALTSSEILQYVRAIGNTTGGSVRALHRIVDDLAEALEFRVPDQFPAAGRPLSELKLKKNLLVACISRLDHVIIPQGSDRLLPGDIVVVVTTAQQTLTDLNDIFAES